VAISKRRAERAPPLIADVRSHLKPIRLEELLRVASIALVAAVAGVLTYYVYEFASTGEDMFVLSIMVLITSLAIALPVTLLVGACLHLVLRAIPLPRLVILAVFLATGALVTWIWFPASWPKDFVLVFTIVTTAWLLYSFGPFRLWKFEYDDQIHSDF
jgi:hypothetical protein